MTLFVIEADKSHDDVFSRLTTKGSKCFEPANSFQIIIEKT